MVVLYKILLRQTAILNKSLTLIAGRVKWGPSGFSRLMWLKKDRAIALAARRIMESNFHKQHPTKADANLKGFMLN